MTSDKQTRAIITAILYVGDQIACALSQIPTTGEHSTVVANGIADRILNELDDREDARNGFA